MKFRAWFLLFPLASLLVAQTPPADSLAGSWVNDNVDNPGVTQVVMRRDNGRILVRGWGRCTPSDCDWGEASADTWNGYLIVNWDHGFLDGAHAAYPITGWAPAGGPPFGISRQLRPQ